MHVNMAGRGGGQGYPGALLGTIAFTEAGLPGCAVAARCRSAVPADRRQGPAPDRRAGARCAEAGAREADAGGVRRRTRRARSIARSRLAAEFGLDPIVVGAAMAAERKAELAAAKARVILSLNFPGGGGGGAAPPLAAAVVAARGGGGGTVAAPAEVRRPTRRKCRPQLAQANVAVRVHAPAAPRRRTSSAMPAA